MKKIDLPNSELILANFRIKIFGITGNEGPAFQYNIWNNNTLTFESPLLFTREELFTSIKNKTGITEMEFKALANN